MNIVFHQSWSQRRKKNWPNDALLYVRTLLQSWVVCPVSQQMIFAYFRPLMVMLVVRRLVRQGWRGLSAEMTGGGVELVDRVTSSKLHIDKAGGGGVAVAPTGSVMGKWSCQKMTLPHRCWTCLTHVSNCSGFCTSTTWKQWKVGGRGRGWRRR